MIEPAAAGRQDARVGPGEPTNSAWADPPGIGASGGKEWVSDPTGGHLTRRLRGACHGSPHRFTLEGQLDTRTSRALASPRNLTTWTIGSTHRGSGPAEDSGRGPRGWP